MMKNRLSTEYWLFTEVIYQERYYKSKYRGPILNQNLQSGIYGWVCKTCPGDSTIHPTKNHCSTKVLS